MHFPILLHILVPKQGGGVSEQYDEPDRGKPSYPFHVKRSRQQIYQDAVFLGPPLGGTPAIAVGILLRMWYYNELPFLGSGSLV